MSILVTGGAGYIGSVTTEFLRSSGEEVVVLDNLSRGHRSAVSEDIPFYEGSVGDQELVERIVKERDVEACVHFAAFAYVGESVERPELYFENNVVQGIRLLSSLVRSGVRAFVFSSTCATYGEPVRVPMDEEHPQQPTNPYGDSKLVLERVLAAYDQAHQFRSVALRYFNAAGASETRGELHDPEPHLIPNVLRAARGELAHVSIFGDDYPTPDGTAVRDYIHVLDLAQAHAAALTYLRDGGRTTAVNLGTGSGHSVLDVVSAARDVTGSEIPVRMEPRRPGDPTHLVACAEKAHQVLNWKAEWTDLRATIGSAWQWILKNSPENPVSKS